MEVQVSAIKQRVKPKLAKPPMYKVILLNDDYTPMEFVVEVVQEVFRKTREEATEVMLTVHREGSAICGLYSHEVAETKVFQVLSKARMASHPLQCILEKE